MLTSIFWSVALRSGQVVIESSTTLLCSLLVAGIMRRMLGAAGTRRLFGGPGINGLLRAWGVGTLLPVCSLGVIPIAREMRRAGVPSGTVLAFVLAAPHINPLSLLYGLTLSEPVVIICFALGSLVIALSAGLLWDRLFARDEDTASPDDEPMPAPGLKRLAAVAVTAALEAIGPTMGFVLLAILLTGLLSGSLPHGCLSTFMRHDDGLSPALMAAVALPLYIGPLQGMMRLGLMFEHGNSVGAAFTLFELGIGLNIGMIAWLMSLFGWRRIILWTGLVTGVTLALAYAAEQPLYFATEEASHTHAFDEWTSPFVVGSPIEAAAVRDRLLHRIEVLEPVSMIGLALLVALGLACRKFDARGWLESWLTQASSASPRPPSLWHWKVPGPVLGLTVLGGLIVFSVAALYIYYPAPDDVFREIVHVRADAIVAVRTGHTDEAVRQIQHWDLLTRKLQVGVYIRAGNIGPEAAKLTEDLRESLEELRDALLSGEIHGITTMLPRIEAAYQSCRDAYRSTGDGVGE
jgi:uncharacterized membrane protein YraQ (UPF0718 family)